MSDSKTKQLPLDELDRKLLRVAASASRETGLTIASHTGEGTVAVEQLEIIVAERVSPTKFVWAQAQNDKRTTGCMSRSLEPARGRPSTASHRTLSDSIWSVSAPWPQRGCWDGRGFHSATHVRKTPCCLWSLGWLIIYDPIRLKFRIRIIRSSHYCFAGARGPLGSTLTTFQAPAVNPCESLTAIWRDSPGSNQK
jgi:hypothetical protein